MFKLQQKKKHVFSINPSFSSQTFEKLFVWGHAKITSLKNWQFLSPHHHFHSFALIFQTLYPCHQAKSNKLFLDKRSVKVYSLFNIILCITQYPIPGFHFWTVKQQNTFDLYFIASIRHQMLSQLQSSKILLMFLWRRFSAEVDINCLNC